MDLEMRITPEAVSWIFLCVGLILGGITLMASSASQREMRAGWIAAFLVCAVDFVIEVYAVKMDWWQLHGALPVYGVPIVYPAGWIFITFHFLMIYAALRKHIRWFAVMLPMFVLGACAGILWNYLGSTHLGTMSFYKATLWHVLYVWAPLTALGLLSYQVMTRVKKE